MTSGFGLSDAPERVRPQRSDWAEKSPVRDMFLYQNGFIARIFTAFAVLCTTLSLSLLIRPLHYLGVCVSKSLEWLRLRSLIQRYPIVSLIGCQIGALILSCSWWPSSGSLVNVTVSIALWLLDIGILFTAASKLADYPPTFDRIRTLIEQAWLERWFASRMNNPLDAYFVREVLLSTLLMLPAWIVLLQNNALYPMNCLFFIVSFGQNGMRHEVIDHTNMHSRLFQCNRSSSFLTRWAFGSINIYLAFVLNPLNLRVPYFYNVNHLYSHPVEDNGADDVQSTV